MNYIRMNYKNTLIKTEIWVIIGLAMPIIANGILESFYGFMNTLLVARLGQAELAVTALVSMLFSTLMVIFWGIFSGMSIIIAHYHGAKNKRAIIGVMRDGLMLSFVFSLPVMCILWFAPYFFEWTGQSALIVSESKKYLHALTFAVPVDLPGFVFMQLFNGISRPKINVMFTISYIPLLIIINYCLMFGKLGLPAMGLTGIGWGTAIAYAIFLVAMWFFTACHPYYKTYVNMQQADTSRYFREILKMGLPLGGMYSLEIGFLFLLAILMGKFGSVTLEAHQIVMQYFFLFSTICFCIAQALSIRVGFHLGNQKKILVLPVAIIGQGIMLVYSLLIICIYLFLPMYLIKLDFSNAYMPDPLLSATIIKFFALVAVFQLIDNARITVFGVLRGMKDTRFTLFASIVQFWLLGLPLSYSGGFVFFKHPIGLWLGMTISAVIGFLLLLFRLRYLANHPHP